MKALVGAFNQEKALVGAFSVFVKTDYETDGSSAALLVTRHMVAARRIRAGETVMEDTPLTFGPLSSSGGKTRLSTHYL